MTRCRRTAICRRRAPPPSLPGGDTHVGGDHDLPAPPWSETPLTHRASVAGPDRGVRPGGGRHVSDSATRWTGSRLTVSTVSPHVAPPARTLLQGRDTLAKEIAPTSSAPAGSSPRPLRRRHYGRGPRRRGGRGAPASRACRTCGALTELHGETVPDGLVTRPLPGVPAGSRTPPAVRIVCTRSARRHFSRPPSEGVRRFSAPQVSTSQLLHVDWHSAAARGQYSFRLCRRMRGRPRAGLRR